MPTTFVVITLLVAIAAFAWFLRGRGGKPQGERRTAEAVVRAKRRVVFREGGEERTRNLVSFELVSGSRSGDRTGERDREREDLDVDPHVFDRLEEGCRGVLTWEDTRFVSFRSAETEGADE
jgi:hypothetical protein